jgi:hypothetical protein
MFFQGVEKKHVLMTDSDIFGKQAELLRIRILRDNTECMNNAWAYLTPLDPGERYFSKILYKEDEISALHRTTSDFRPLLPLRLLSAQSGFRRRTGRFCAKRVVVIVISEMNRVCGCVGYFFSPCVFVFLCD